MPAGGNAVDAADAAVLTSFVAESLLTRPGRGRGYLLAVPPDGVPVLPDFFVECRPGLRPGGPGPLEALTVDFDEAAASCGTYGTPAGLAGLESN